MSKNSRGYPIKTRFRGQYVNNDDLQKMLLNTAIDARMNGDVDIANYCKLLADKLEKLKD